MAAFSFSASSFIGRPSVWHFEKQKSDLSGVCVNHLAISSSSSSSSQPQTISRNRLSVRTKAAENAPTKNSILCTNCDGNGMVQCSQCKGSGVNSIDHFNGQFKAGAVCWLCRGKKEMLCGNCNGAGFLGGFMTTPEE